MKPRKEAVEGRGILSVIGNTPLVQLTKAIEGLGSSLFAKLEALNPGGSIKDRPALTIIREGIESGAITRDTVIVESSSGNMGIGIAQACAYFGLRFICVIDPKTTPQNVKLLEAYGAEADLVSEPDPQTGEFLQARLNRVKSLLKAIPNAFWPDQYSNLHNPLAHHRTMEEVVSVLGREPDYLFCATSTCGTLRGCVELINKRRYKTKVIAVDAVGSVIFGSERAKRLIPGHGAGVIPALFRPDLASECVHVTDLDCIVGCRRLIRREGILAGGSSGAVLMAVESIKHRIPDGKLCVAIFPDRGERYLDTIFCDRWVRDHFGEVLHLWESSLRRPPGRHIDQEVPFASLPD
jgi:cysteine synthase A